MAAFREHVTFSTILGIGYAGALRWFGWDPGEALLAGGLCGVAGMLPDLDSDSGRPIKEIFGLLAAVTSMFALHRLHRSSLAPADRILAACGCYLFVRFIISWLFAKLTVHRGMWHSLPAAAIVTLLTFLAASDAMGDQFAMILGGGVCLGFMSHLVLDEIYSVQFNGLPRVKKSFGTAIKLFSDGAMASLACWLMLGAVSYQTGVKLGYAEDVMPRAVAQARDVKHALLTKMGVDRENGGVLRK